MRSLDASKPPGVCGVPLKALWACMAAFHEYKGKPATTENPKRLRKLQKTNKNKGKPQRTKEHL